MTATVPPFPTTTRWGLRLTTVGVGFSFVLGSAAVGAAASSAGAATASPAATHGPFNAAKWGDPKADKASEGPKGHHSATLDPGSLYTIENAIGVRKVWAQKDSTDRQITGQGVTVALLDSGAAAVPGLDSAGKLTHGPDLSIEGNGVLTDLDTFGHGTHLAGIIAARDPVSLTARTIPTLAPSVQLGVAPDAGLLSLKLATTDGSTDVSQVIAALNWITENQNAPDGTRVRVVNLAFGTDSLQLYQIDPLAAAAENAWRHGLVVVVSGGNEGQEAAGLTDPAIDPYVVAVGASASGGTVDGWSEPTVADFSSRGTASRHVDLLAPGRSIASLRAPGSFVDVNHPEGLVSEDASGRLFRGSGTSQATAVVSGAAALLLQSAPNLTPDQVKALLISTATPVEANVLDSGAGQINVAAAVAAAKRSGSGSRWTGSGARSWTMAAQSYPLATGQGSLQAARGGSVLVDPDGVPLEGEVDVQGNTWDAAAWWAASSTGTSWSGGKWMGVTWSGDTWISSSGGLQSARWDSARWDSARWDSARWDSARWDSVRWADLSWG